MMKKLLFTLLPKNYASYGFGILSRMYVPEFLRGSFYSWYSRKYGVKLAEARDDISQFSSLSKFFLRELKPGLRPIGKGIVSPVDGKLTAQGSIKDQQIVQAKGQEYSLAELLADEKNAQQFEGGYFVTIYLAPGDYHHVHAPIAGNVTSLVHAEGALWPVNSWSVSNVENLFVINERMTVLLESDETDFPQGRCAVVFVGATNVGAISLEHFKQKGNRFRFPWQRPSVHKAEPDTPARVERGERIGSFCLGSTVVLLFSPGMFEPGEHCVEGDIKLGTPLAERT